MKFGTGTVSALKLGTADVSKVYLGASLVWEAGGAYSPAVLFAASEPGFWATVETSRLWQDTARTTPVTTAGDPVGSWELTTASGVIYATQSTAGSRPVYRIDSDGVSYLDFAGNKALVTPTITPGTDKMQVFLGVQNGATGSYTVIMESSNTSDSNNGAFFMATLTAASNHRIRYRSKGTAIANAESGDVIANGTKNVWTGLGDIAADTCIARVNSVQLDDDTANQGTGNYLAHVIHIGARNGNTLWFLGRLYVAIVRFGPNLTGTDLSDPEDWITGIMNP